MSKLATVFICGLFALCGCTSENNPAPADAQQEMLSRTEFTNRIENFFEYAPLKANQPSDFLIHLTDLTDGSPVEQAEVTLTAVDANTKAVAAQTKAQVGRVTGIYVAELTPPSPGDYVLEFHVKNAKLDERMTLNDFKVD